MSNYFNPEDVITAQGIVSNITRNGAGFISTKDGVDVFVPVRLVETSGIEMGDSVTVYMVKNFGDSSLKNINDSASYRALRVKIDGRLGNDFMEVKAIPMSIIVDPFPPVTSAVVNQTPPVTTEKLKMGFVQMRDVAFEKIESGFVGNSTMLHAELVKELPEFDLMSDDSGARSKLEISNALISLHKDGRIAKASICGNADQKQPSFVAYALTPKELFNAIIGA